MGGRRSQRDRTLIEGCGNGFVRQSQQQAAFARRKFIRLREAGEASQT
jgi:hypothetical protein